MKPKYIITLLFVAFLLLGCTTESYLQETDLEYMYTLAIEDDFLVQSYQNYIAVSDIYYNLDSYSCTTQLYSLEDGEFLCQIKLKEDDWQMGLYDQGFYAISLSTKTLYEYNFQGKSTKTVIDKGNGIWSFAMLSKDGKYILYGQGDVSSLFVENLETKTVVDLCTISGTWEPIDYADGYFFIKNTSEGELIAVDPENDSVEAVFANKDINYIAPHYSAYTTEEALVIYDTHAEETYEIYFQNENEYTIASGPTGIVTFADDKMYYYHMEDQKIYHYTFEEEIQKVIVKDEGLLLMTREGEVYLLDTSLADKTTSIPIIANKDLIGEHRISVENMSQRPNYPTGCESVSTVMLMNYVGEDIDVDTFIDDYLYTTKIEYDASGTMYADSPYESFIGDPRSEASYGCMAPVIEDALISYYGSNQYVVNTTGMSLKSLCVNYISKDIPVLVWASIGMIDIYPTSTWILPNGDEYTWLANEHCLLLVGFDEYCYYFNDPWTGRTVGYNRSICESRYERLGSQSLTIYK